MSSLHRAFALFLNSADECFKDTPKALLEKGIKRNSALQIKA